MQRNYDHTKWMTTWRWRQDYLLVYFVIIVTLEVLTETLFPFEGLTKVELEMERPMSKTLVLDWFGEGKLAYINKRQYSFKVRIVLWESKSSKGDEELGSGVIVQNIEHVWAMHQRWAS